jgi:hypothetical protein
MFGEALTAISIDANHLVMVLTDQAKKIPGKRPRVFDFDRSDERSAKP